MHHTHTRTSCTYERERGASVRAGGAQHDTPQHNVTTAHQILRTAQNITTYTTHHSIKRHQHSKNITAAQIKVPHHITSHHITTKHNTALYYVLGID